jgi:hypothetical protein
LHHARRLLIVCSYGVEEHARRACGHTCQVYVGYV